MLNKRNGLYHYQLNSYKVIMQSIRNVVDSRLAGAVELSPLGMK